MVGRYPEQQACVAEELNLSRLYYVPRGSDGKKTVRFSEATTVCGQAS